MECQLGGVNDQYDKVIQIVAWYYSEGLLVAKIIFVMSIKCSLTSLVFDHLLLQLMMNVSRAVCTFEGKHCNKWLSAFIMLPTLFPVAFYTVIC